MKKIFYLALAVLCIGMVATSCKKHNKEDDQKATIEDLGGGYYKVNGYRFVDLGLPSGLLWAENNVGASSATAEGSYFAWGETTAKTSFTADNYKFGKDESSYTKYSSKDGKQTLDAEDDAATVALKAPCRTPLKAEFQELLNTEYTTCTWTTKGSVNGLEVKSKKNGNSIFLPAYKYSGKNGDYWAADLYPNLPFDYDLATSYSFTEAAGSNAQGSQMRYNGNSVRPVASNLK